MKEFVTIIAIAILVLIVANLLPIKIKTKPAKKYDLKRYYLKSSIVTPVERWMYRIIQEELPNDYLIAPKVGIKDFVGITKGQNYIGHFGHIAQKHIDFLICKKEDLSPVLGIEIDDNSHQKTDRKQRDQEVNQIYNAVGLKIIHIPTKITENALRNAIRSIFNCNESPSTTPDEAAAHTETERNNK